MLGFGGQTAPGPTGKGFGLIIADVDHRRIKRDRLRPAQGKGPPRAILLPPVERMRPCFALRHGMTFHQP